MNRWFLVFVLVLGIYGFCISLWVLNRWWFIDLCWFEDLLVLFKGDDGGWFRFSIEVDSGFVGLGNKIFFWMGLCWCSMTVSDTDPSLAQSSQHKQSNNEAQLGRPERMIRLPRKLLD